MSTESEESEKKDAKKPLFPAEIKCLGSRNLGCWHKRRKYNLREKIFIKEWKQINKRYPGARFGFGILQNLFCTEDMCHLVIEQRDRFIVSTVIQWLGSNVGFGFLRDVMRRCGYKIVRDT